MRKKTNTGGQRMEKINLRVPAGLRKKLKTIAEREGRSMNSQAVRILAESLENAA